MKKGIIAACIFVVLMMGMLSANALAAEVVDSGKCDGDAKWTMDENNVLTITAEGETEDGTYNLDEIWTTRYREVEKIVIEEGITNIGEDAFLKFINLTSVTLSKSVVEIDANAFNAVNLVEIVVDADNPRFCDENGVLYNKEKTELIRVPMRAEGELEIADSVKTIRAYAFNGCTSLNGIKIPDSITDIEENAFASCLLDSIVIPESVKEIGSGTFSYSGIEEVVFENSNIVFDLNAFSMCYYLESIEIKGSDIRGLDILLEKVMEDGENSFFSSDGCGVLFNGDKSEIIYVSTDTGMIVVPESVTEIRKNAFNYCENLDIIEFLGDAPYFEEGTFANISANVFYPEDNETWTENVIQSIKAEGEWVLEMTSEKAVEENPVLKEAIYIIFGVIILIFIIIMAEYGKRVSKKVAEETTQNKEEQE